MDIRTVAVGTNSDLKVRAVQSAFQTLGRPVEILRYNADSGVPAQPEGKRIMEQGATNRAKEARKAHPDADLFIGIENGLVTENNRWFDPACVVVLGKGGEFGMAFSAHFPIPGYMVELVRSRNSELGEVVKELAGGGEKDPMKWLSDDGVPREELLSQALLCALAEILHPERYARPI